MDALLATNGMGSLPDDSQAAHALAVAEITRAIAVSLDVSQIFEVVSRLARHVISHDALLVFRLPTDPASDPPDQLALAYCYLCHHEDSHIEAGRCWPPADFSFGPALLANQAVIIADLAATALQNAGDQALLGCGRAALVVPIYAPPRVLGGLVLLGRPTEYFAAGDVLLVEQVADLLAVALEHQRLHQQASALAVAEERNRLAREIHDTLTQSLTGIIINLESLRPYDRSLSPGITAMLAQTEALARSALEEARRSVLGLHPTPLAHRSLHEALANELAGLARRATLATQFYAFGEERPLGPDQAMALFRIAQEAFQNIYKHAAAHHVMLGLAFEAVTITLTVDDDGIGFLPEAREPDEQGGFGLLSMTARARSLGGDLQVASRPGHGTVVRATVPYIRPETATAAVVLQDRVPVMPAPSDRPIRVLLADDHTVTRQGIRRILDGQPDIQIIGEASDGHGAIAQTARLRPDVVLLDIQMPRLSGIDALPSLRAAHPVVEVVMLTMFDHDEQVFASLKAGARGYVLKDASPETFMAAIRAASRGQSLLPPNVTTRVVDRFAVLARRDADPDALTGREAEVLRRVAQGLRYKEIAAELHITVKTVQYHITNILSKLGAGSRSEAVAVARKRGLLGPQE
jgi:DNA-binding NarL/FixJ family response regulator/signal transduction histidine kinase